MTDGRGLFGSVLWRGGAFEATTDGAWLQAMLDAEAALVWAQADLGLLSPASAQAVVRHCRADALGPDAIEEIGRGAADGGNPVIPLVRRLVAAVDTDPDAPPGSADAVHHGATSQDIIDTAAMMVCRNAIAAVAADLDGAIARCDALADEHRHTVMVGRTLGQAAELTTFGFKAAGWLSGLAAARRQLLAMHGPADPVLAAQLGGPVGTLSSYGNRGAELLGAYARRLDLAAPEMAWHTERSRIGRVATVLGVTAGVVAKVATDIVLLSQSEVAEVTDTAPARGGSSSMPHKRNPVAAISARASAQTVPGSVATLLGAMGHEHERAAGSWHAEWLPLVAALRATGSAVAWLGAALEYLAVDGATMAARARTNADLLQAPALAAALTPALGTVAAHDLVAAAVQEALTSNIPLRMVLAENPAAAATLNTATTTATVPADAAMVDFAGSDQFIDRVRDRARLNQG
ncbi:MAG: lyase family protein [Acidimicrobiales bacterium]